jgi:arabinofuranan 3-O-arabinosyltransferase
MTTTVTREPAGRGPAGSVVSAGTPAVVPPDGPSRLVERARLIAACLGFLGLALSQSPGRVVADTKLDLTVDPLTFLGRALTLWEPGGFAGQVQNQAYGYLFPMGPFFAAGQLLGLPEWVVQRLWWALLMSAAFLGVVVLARRLGIGTPLTAVAGGIVYALAPRMVTALGATSVEVLPMALAPWVLVPLAGATRSGSPRRAAALSGLAVFCVGGVNAVATAAVLPLPVLYLLTRPAGPFRRRLTAWWVAAVGLATAWWVGPLLLLGRYSPPFLDYIETAAVTTAPTDVLSVLRGTSHWVAALGTPAGPLWPAGWSLVTQVFPVAGTVALAAAGLVALTRRDLPERTWLVLGLLAGVGLVTLGHLATVDGLLAGPLRDALDGPLAPLRNVHKFDAVLRLPLVLGLVHLGSILVRRVARHPHVPPGRPAWWGDAIRHAARGVLVLLAAALVTSGSPALAGRLAAPAGFEQIPGYWRQTAEFLAETQPSGRALLVPGSSFGSYVWGHTNDEPMQPMAKSAWEVRNAVPLTPGGHIRVLDVVEERLARGKGSAGLTRYLARAGISHLVVRNDLDTGAGETTRSILVHRALRDSPGISPVAAFGPAVPGAVAQEGLVLDAGLADPAPALEVYEVADPAPRAWTSPLSDAVTVSGGPDGVLALEDRGLVTDRPTVQAGASPAGTGAVMVSDALVQRERAFGRLTEATSAGLAPEDPLRLDAPARDYPVPGQEAAESVVRYDGGTPSASSSASDPDSVSGARPDAAPWAAVDGDPGTAWRPAQRLGEPRPVWWRLETDRPFLAAGVTLSLPADGADDAPAEIRLSTDTGQITRALARTSEPQQFPLPAGYTRSLTVTSARLPEGGEDPSLALAEVQLPGITVTRTVVTPAPQGTADVYAFDVARPGRAGCVPDAAGAPRCAATLVAGSEESQGLDRVLTVDGRADYDLELGAVPRPGPALDALLAEARGDDVRVEASSTAVEDPKGSPLAAMDGDPDTAWVAAGDDRRPSLVLSWPEPTTIDHLRVVDTPGLAAAFPTAVTLDDGGLPRLLDLDDDGSVRFRALRTDRLTVTFELPLELNSFDPYSRRIERLGIGVSELEVGAANREVDPDTVVSIPCGNGPVVTVDGEPRETSARTTLGRLTALDPMDLRICRGSGTAELGSGEHRLVATDTDVLAVDSATLTRSRAAEVTVAGSRQPVEARRWEAEHRTVEVSARSETTLLVVPENTNSGWTATLDGRRLDTVAVDGWQQGYVLPAGPAGTVDLEFGPGAVYRSALAGGAGAVLLLALLAVLPVRSPPPMPSRRPRRGARPALVLTALAGTALVAGVWGVAVLGVLWAAAAWAGARRQLLLGTTAATAVVAAGGLLLAVPAGTATARQVLAIVALMAVVTGVLPAVRRPIGPPGLPRHRGRR